MDEGLCGLLCVRAVSLKEKAPASLAVSGGSAWRSKSCSGPTPVCGKGLRAALVFARVPRGSSSVPPKPHRQPQLSAVQANGLEALLRAAAPVASGSLLPPRLPLVGDEQSQRAGARGDGRPPLPRLQEVRASPPKVASLAVEGNWVSLTPPGGRNFCEDAPRLPLVPRLPQLSVAEDMANDEPGATQGDEEEVCGEDEEEVYPEEGDIYEAEPAGDDSLLRTGTMSSAIDAETEADVADPDGDALADRDNNDGAAGDADEGDHSDASSDTSAEAVPESGRKTDEPSQDVTPAIPEAADAESTVPKKKKKKKRKKKRRKSSKTVEEPVKITKRPPVPRFPHPENLTPKHNDEDWMAVAATTVPVTDRSPAINMKERFPKHLILGRFPRRPLATLLGEGLEEGAAHEVQGTESGEAGLAEEGTGGQLTSLAAAESLGLVLEASNSSWSRPRRSQSHDGAAVRAHRKGSGSADGEEAARNGAADKASRRHRARSEAPRNDMEDSNPLSITGHKPKATKNKLSVGSMQWLKAQAQEEKKKVQESGDAALGSLYFSYSSMKDEEGRKIPLKNREKAVRILHDLNTKVAIPICRFFKLRYNFFSEHHCQAKKAGVTVKEPLILRKQGEDGVVTEETRHLVTIRLRVRVHASKGDPQKDFISKGTQLAVLLHELCHLKHMNHGKDFMLFLRDVFAQATKLGIFNPAELHNEIPSPWPWENEIFKRGGDVSNEELLALFLEHKALQREKAKAAGENSAREAEAAALTAATAADTGSTRPAADAVDTVEKRLPHTEVEDLPEASSPVPPPPMPVEATPSEAPSAHAVTPPPGAVPHRARKMASSAILNLAAAFEKGSREECTDECCEDPAGPTAMEYGDGDLLEFEADAASQALAITMPARRSRSHSRGRGSRSVSRSSSVVKLPQLSPAASPVTPPVPDGSPGYPVRGWQASGIPTLPPV